MSARTTRRGVAAVAALGVAAAVALGAYDRYWLASHTIGALTSDGAVIGLMALHLLHHGQFPAYMWGQAYGGSLEMAATAVVFAVAGVGTSSLLATTALTTALAMVAMWRGARRIVGDPAAIVAALAAWVGSSLLAWRSVKPGGSYLVGLALAWLAILWLARLHQGERSVRVLALVGLCCGLSLWTSPMTLQLLVPALLWCFVALRALGRRLLVVVAFGLLGALPVVVYGAAHHFANLAPPGGGHAWDGFGTRLVQFFTQEVPIAASLRVEGSLHWVLGAAGPLLAVALGIAFALVALSVLRGRSARCVLPVLTLALLPFFYAANTLASHVGQGRYVEVGTTMGFVLLGVGVERAARAAASRSRSASMGAALRLGTCAAAVAALGALGATAMRDEPGTLAELSVGGVPMPADDAALLALVRAHHVVDAFAGYWIAYRVTFETREHTLVTPFSLGRYPPIRHAVRASAHPAYLFVATSPTWPRFVAWCAAHGVATSTWHRGAFVVVQPRARVLPNELPRGVLGARPPPGAKSSPAG